VKVPSYEATFRAFSLRLELQEPLSGDPAADARAVISALRAGRVYTAFDSIAGPGTLTFTAESGGEVARQGDALPTRGPVRLRAVTNGTPQASVQLLRDGKVIRRVDGPSLEWETDQPGAYRIEAQLPGAPGEPPLPWIVSNPIYVGLPATREHTGALPPASARLVWPAGSWHIEKDARSTGRAVTSADGGLVRHTLRYELAREAASPFVALGTTDVGAMHDAARIAFRAGADRPMRVSVQVRVLDGTVGRRWQRSVYLSPEPRDVTVTFADMRVVGTGAREALAPARIHSLLFVLDSVNARPGDGGALWVEGIRTER